MDNNNFKMFLPDNAEKFIYNKDLQEQHDFNEKDFLSALFVTVESRKSVDTLNTLAFSLDYERSLASFKTNISREIKERDQMMHILGNAVTLTALNYLATKTPFSC